MPDSKSESDQDYEPPSSTCEVEAKSDQKYAVEGTSIKHCHDPHPSVTDIEGTCEIGSEKGNLEDNTDLTIASKDKYENTENSGHVSSNDTRKMCSNPKRSELDGNQPLGMTLSANRSKAYELPSTDHEVEAERMSSSNMHISAKICAWFRFLYSAGSYTVTTTLSSGYREGCIAG